jgi:hypothetical protein
MREKSRKSKLGYNRTLYMKASVHVIVAGGTKSSYQRSLLLKWYQTVGIVEKVKTLRERAAMLRYTHSACLFKRYRKITQSDN